MNSDVDSFRQWIQAVVALLYAIVIESRKNRLPLLAGGLAYYAFISLPAVLVLFLHGLGLVGGEAFASRAFQRIGVLTGPGSSNIVETVVAEASNRIGVSILSLGVLLWAGSRLFTGLAGAFNEIYSLDPGGFKYNLRATVVGMFTTAVSLTIAIGVITEIGNIAGQQFVSSLRPIITLVILFAAFYPAYYVIPRRLLAPVEVLPGTLFAAFTWTVTNFLFNSYSEMILNTSFYSVIGTVILLFVWLYMASIILLLGCVINAVLSGDSTDVSRSDWKWFHKSTARAEAQATLSDALAEIDTKENSQLEFTVNTTEEDYTVPTPENVTVSEEDVESIFSNEKDEQVVEVKLSWRQSNDQTDESHQQDN